MELALKIIVFSFAGILVAKICFDIGHVKGKAKQLEEIIEYMEREDRGR